MGQRKGRIPMKRLLSVTLALALLGSSAVMAQPYSRGGDYRHGYTHSAPYRGGYGYGYRDHRGSDAAAAVGVGILALGLFGALASQNDHYYDRGYYAPPPPPSPAYYGYRAPSYGYGVPGYGYGAPGYGFSFGYRGYR
jgi:hypothetical protein